MPGTGLGSMADPQGGAGQTGVPFIPAGTGIPNGGVILATNLFASGQREGLLADYGPRMDFEADLRMLTSHLLLTNPLAPTAAAGANAGTSPPAPVVGASAGDTRGSLTWGTGTTPAAGAQVVVTFQNATAYPTAPQGVMLTPTNAAFAALQPFVSSVTATGFTISTAVAPAASQANTTYGVSWLVVG